MKKHISFHTVVLVIVAVKILLSALIPLTGDEAYFIVWGQHPDYGYYDHPPMAGWFITAMQFLSGHYVAYRLMAVLTTVAVAYIIRALALRFAGRQEAELVAYIYLASPQNILNIFFTTDTPLLLFAAVSLFLFMINRERRSAMLYLLCGVALGAAFLSKYFAVLLYAAYIGWFLFRRDKGWFKGLFLIGLGALPLVLVNIWWNYNNCWTNILFNVYNRNKQAGFQWGHISGFLLTQLYFALPWMLFWLMKWRKKGEQTGRELFLLYLVPMALFLLVSMKAAIGMHWVLAFYPAYFASLALIPAEYLKKGLKITVLFGLVHLLLLIAVAVVPVELFSKHRKYDDAVFYTDPSDICAALETYRQQGAVVAAVNYDPAAVLSYHCGYYVINFMDESKYGRYDDKITDMMQLDGKTVVTVSTAKMKLEKYAPYFSSVRMEQIESNGASFPVVVGTGFHAEAYRTGHLAKVQELYYRIPAWLPTGGCYFNEKYGDCGSSK